MRDINVFEGAQYEIESESIAFEWLVANSANSINSVYNTNSAVRANSVNLEGNRRVGDVLPWWYQC